MGMDIQVTYGRELSSVMNGTMGFWD